MGRHCVDSLLVGKNVDKIRSRRLSHANSSVCLSSDVQDAPIIARSFIHSKT